jgi:hypothetical protein
MGNQLVSQDSKLYYICNRVLELDDSIRFAGFVNYMAAIIACQYKDGLDPLLKTTSTSSSSNRLGT